MNFPLLLVLVALLVPCLCDDWSAPCNRTRCICKWTNGKKSALCNDGEHIHVPATLSTDLQVLSLNENHISHLNREEFYQNGLEHLQRIFIKNSRVQHVHRDAFKNLKILVEIDLSENAIETLEPGTFTGNDRLRILYLYGNPLKHLFADQFPTLPHLRTLDLHDCALQSIHEHAFLRVEQLEYLNLQNNSLAALEANTLVHLQVLKTLLLGDNPWTCDCKLRAFRNWYVATNYPRLSCVLPARHAGAEWDTISPDLFGCLPSVHLVADHNVQLEDIGPTNASFHCLVSGDPVPEITWELNGSPLAEGYNVVVETGVLWSNLSILNVTNYDSGTYTCRAWNLVGEVEQNATLFLPEVVEHVIVKTHETFWYFGLIVGIFGTVFALLLVSVSVCYCRRAALQRNRRRLQQQKKQQQQRMSGSGRMKGSVSFTDREKRLLDLSLTNDRMDSCELVNTPSTTVTLNNSVSVGYTQHKVGEGMEQQRVNEEFAMFPPPPAEFSCGMSGVVVPHLYADQGPVLPSTQYSAGRGHGGTGYGNIFISVAVTGDAMDDQDTNGYPDLLNIPNRRRESAVEGSSQVNGETDKHSHPQEEEEYNAGGMCYAEKRPFSGIIVSDCTLPQQWTMGDKNESLVSPPRVQSVVLDCNPVPQQSPSAYATLPRHPRPPQFFSAIGARSGSPCGSGGSGNSSTGNGHVPPLVISHTNNGAVQCRELPHEQEQRSVLTYRNGQTVARPMSHHAGQLYSHSAQASPVAVGRAGGSEGGCGPTNYDNIGRRITASGNAAIKVPGTEDEDEEDGEAMSVWPSDSESGNAGNKTLCSSAATMAHVQRQKPNGSGPVNNGVIRGRRTSLDNVAL